MGIWVPWVSESHGNKSITPLYTLGTKCATETRWMLQTVNNKINVFFKYMNWHTKTEKRNDNWDKRLKKQMDMNWIWKRLRWAEHVEWKYDEGLPNRRRWHSRSRRPQLRKQKTDLTRLPPRESTLDDRWTRKPFGLSRVQPIYIYIYLNIPSLS